MNEPYTTLILGGGPIAASTAYFLAKNGGTNIGLITQDPIENRDSTYLYAGGSLRWFWPDALKTEMTSQTAAFIADLDAQGIDLSLIKDNYLFLHTGKFVPSYNISSKKLIEWFLEQSKTNGVTTHMDEVIQSIKKEGELWIVTTDKNEYKSYKILSALGTKNKEFISGYGLETEKRKLYVVDVPVGENEEHFPHTIAPIKNGVAYVFIKKFPEGLRFVIGQEGVLDEEIDEDPNREFQQLLNEGLDAIMPFLQKSHVEKLLWGFDSMNKNLTLEESQPGLFVANCGSAIRACAWIGQEVAKKLQG